MDLTDHVIIIRFLRHEYILAEVCRAFSSVQFYLRECYYIWLGKA